MDPNIKNNIAEQQYEVLSHKESSSNELLERLMDHRNPHVHFSTKIVHELDSGLYVKDHHGNIMHVPSTTNFKYGDISKSIYIRTNIMTMSRKRQLSVAEDELVVRIKESDLDRNGVIHVGMMGILISRNRKYLEQYNLVLLDPYKNRVITTLEDIVERGKDFPLTVFLNDPSGKLDKVYTTINRSVFELPVHKNTDIGTHNLVKFSSPDPTIADQVYQFDTSTMTTSFEKNNKYVVNVDSYELTIYPDIHSAKRAADEEIKMLETKYLGMSAEEKAKIDSDKEKLRQKFEDDLRTSTRKYEDVIHTKEELIQKKDDTIRNLESKIHYQDVALANLKGTLEQDGLRKSRSHTESLQNLQLKKEEARVVKSSNDVSSSNIGLSTSVFKAAAVVIPVLIGGLGYLSAKLGWLGAAKWVSFTTSKFNTLLGIKMGTVACNILGGIGDAVRCVFSGIKSVCSTIVSWLF